MAVGTFVNLDCLQGSSGFWIPGTGFRILLSMELGYCFPIVEWDSALFELYSGFQQQKFPGIQIPKAKVSWITESGIPQMGRKECLG